MSKAIPAHRQATHHRLPAQSGGAGRAGRRDVCVDLSVAKSVIASRLNLTQEHFSRILHELSALELIKVEGRRLRIPDLESLARHQCELAASGR
jgi:CRP-like cAMP-binding protein